MSTPKATGGRSVREETIHGHKVTSVELDFVAAADLAPDLLAIAGPGYGRVHGRGGEALGDAIGLMAQALTGGKLLALLPRILAGTSVVVPDETGKLTSRHLATLDQINLAFTGRKKLAVPVVKLALEVSFSDFFDGIDLESLTQVPTE